MATTKTTQTTTMTEAEEKKALKKLEKIATEHLMECDTLERRWSDSLDFFEVSVWSLRRALLEAYAAGKAAA